uniref:Protein FAM227B n=1 Tax=Esox lucius TaxID=8010 RepID=A0AAY5L0H7_ESOLU
MAKKLDPEDDEELINTFDKFLRQQKLVDWPVAFDETLEISSHFKHCSCSRQIFEYFKVNVPFPADINTSFLKSMEELYSKIQLHEFKMSKSESKNKDLEFDDTNKRAIYVERALKILKDQIDVMSRSLDIKDYNYPGFGAVEGTDIPGLPDALKHLDSISEAQGFNSGFLKIWRPFFLCDLSVAVLKDTFWWFFLNRFKPDVEEENQLFDRISGTYVSLLMTVQRELKDKLFKVYADCLAQAVYTAFYRAFPQSFKRIGHDFKTNLTDIISLWVSGVKVLSWQNWNLSWLDRADMPEESQKDSAYDQEMNFEVLVSSASKLSLSLPEKQKSERITSADSRMNCERELQHVPFKLCGQSPLVSRYIQLYGIPSPTGSHTHTITWSEITNLPYPYTHAHTLQSCIHPHERIKAPAQTPTLILTTPIHTNTHTHTHTHICTHIMNTLEQTDTLQHSCTQLVDCIHAENNM